MAEVPTAPVAAKPSSNGPPMRSGAYRGVRVVAGSKSKVIVSSIRPLREGSMLRKCGIPLVFLAGVLMQSGIRTASAQISAASDQEAWQIAEVMAKKFETAYNRGDVAFISNLFVDNA